MARDGFGTPKKSKWAIPVIVAVVAVALTAGVFVLLQGRAHTGLLASTSGAASGAASEGGGGDWPRYSEVKTFAVAYPEGAVDIPVDAVRFVPRGIATIQTSDGESLRAIANTMLLHGAGGAVRDGLFDDDSSDFPVLFADMEGFAVHREGGFTFVLDIQKPSGNTQLKISGSEKQLLFLRADGDQEAQTLTLDRVAAVAFDWAAPATVQDYMLITRKEGAPVLVPQNMLFTNELSVGDGGFGSYHLRFGIPLQSGTTVEFRRIQQMSIYRTFLWQYNSETSLIAGNGVEIKLKSGDIVKEDMEISYYGSGALRYPSALGVAKLAAGDWTTLQYVGDAAQEAEPQEAP